MPHRALVTGATGFIGGELLLRLLARPDTERVYALVRARDAQDLERRGREALFKLFREDDDARRAAAKRVRFVQGDLGEDGLGLAPADRDEIVASCDRVFHAAASTDFDLPEAQARKVNLDGASRVLELSEAIHRARRLDRHVHISTAYVAGRRSGLCREEELPPPGGPFSNTYESTKASAERLLRSRMGALPITVVRPSIVVGASDTGRTYNFNVLYYPIKLIHRGTLPYVPGLRDTTLDIVPVDYVCEATLALADDERAEGGTFHLTAGDDAIPLRRFGDLVCGFFNRQRAAQGLPPYPPTRILRPWLFRLVMRWVRFRLRRRARLQGQLDAFMIYLPYLLTEKRFATDQARRLLEGRVAYPPIESYLERVADYAVSREWGRRVSWDPALLGSGTWSGSAAGTEPEPAADAAAQAAHAAQAGGPAPRAAGEEEESP